jgi:ankyrin repeat protein
LGGCIETQLNCNSISIINAVVTESQESPLMTACKHRHFDVVKLLLQHGASMDQKNIDGLTPRFFLLHFPDFINSDFLGFHLLPELRHELYSIDYT